MGDPEALVVGHVELATFDADDKSVNVSLWYPRLPDAPVTKVYVDMCCVRAADGLQIEYDFERDGWVIRQAKYFTWESEEQFEQLGYGWTEVAFIQAWASEDVEHVKRVVGSDA